MPSWQEFAPPLPPLFLSITGNRWRIFTQGNVTVCLTFLKDDSD